MTDVVKQITLLSKSYEDADFLPRIFGPFREDAERGNIPVVLFGAGSVGIALHYALTLHGVNPICFCDNNNTRVGNSSSGISIISFYELNNSYKNALVLIATDVEAFSKEICQQLVNNGFASERILSIEHNPLVYYARLAHSRLDINNCAEQLSEAFNLLADQKSRDIFVHRIALFSGGADYESFQKFISNFSELVAQVSTNQLKANCGMNSYYFENDIVRLNDQEVLVDGGAFTGDSAVAFMNVCSAGGLEYKHIYCFEPDPVNFSKLERNVSKCRDTTCLRLGLWKKKSMVQFQNSSSVKPTDCRIVRATGDIENALVTKGNMEIATISIDEEFSNEEISYIKMDVEGAEIEALRGAEETLNRCKPKLAISAYHKREDIYELPLIIHQIYPKYRLYLRHLSLDPFDTVLFGVPQNGQTTVE